VTGGALTEEIGNEFRGAAFRGEKGFSGGSLLGGGKKKLGVDGWRSQGKGRKKT